MAFDRLLSDVPATKLVLSLGVVVALLALRAFVNQALLRRVNRADTRRRWLVGTRNATFLLGLLVLGAIWADALRPFAVSILAFAVAFVIATKELIQSSLASLVRSGTNLYSIGDRVEIGNYRGDVVDYNPFMTTIMEVGPGKAFHMRTGRTISFPNNKILDTYLVNESYTTDYVNHSFSVPLKAEQDWKAAETILLDAARAECGPYLSDAKESMKKLEHAQALDGLAVNPRVAIQLTDPGKLSLLVRFPVPVGRQGRVEQAIIRRFLEQYYAGPPERPNLAGEQLPAGRPAVETTPEAVGDFAI